jgi:lambda repressor-like predicted transcriptional regulator
MTDPNNHFRHRVNARLAKKGWNLRRLAKESGVPYTTLRGMMLDDCDFYYSRAVLVEVALGLRRVNNEEGS